MGDTDPQGSRGERLRFKGAQGILELGLVLPEMRTLGVEAPGAPPPPKPGISFNSFCSCTAARLWNLDACCSSLRLSLLICKMGLQPLFCSEKPPCFADIMKITQRKCLINRNCIVVTHFCPTFLTHEVRSLEPLETFFSPSCLLFFLLSFLLFSPPPASLPPTPQLPSSSFSFPLYTPT